MDRNMLKNFILKIKIYFSKYKVLNHFLLIYPENYAIVSIVSLFCRILVQSCIQEGEASQQHIAKFNNTEF